MRKLTMTTFVSLDGVMQAPGGPDEDRSNGFDKGGWLVPYADEDMGEIMDDWFSAAGGFLLGRKTYEIFAAHWPRVTGDDPIAAALNAYPKYVASRTLRQDQLQWHNSTLLTSELPDEVAQLKQQADGDLQIHGSGELAQTLMQHNLIDVYRLWTYPVVLGGGKRLFRSALPVALRLVDVKSTSTGVVVQTYEPGGEMAYGSFELDTS
jgi:dihydrofolate reductase